MTRITVDNLLREKLLDLASPLELCDDEGRVLAHVTPVKASCEYFPSGPQVSADELRRRAASNERRYSTSEVLKHLDSL
ncbi:MAG TPA: hypothetical protein VF306_04460 [Pirellulales bacterium]